MPRQSTGPRLWLDKKRQTWSIIDGRKSIRTGCGKGELQAAQEVLTAYIAKHHIVTPGKDPLLSDVLKVYAEEHISGVVSASSISYDLANLESWWGLKQASEINTANCKLYIAHRDAPPSARRELGFLNAACMYWHKHEEYGPLKVLPIVHKPPPATKRVRWLTRSEAARFLWATRKLKPNMRRRVRRFFIIGWYTGSRHKAISGVRWDMIDLSAGVMLRRPDGTPETRKKTPPVRIGRRLLSHLRRWKRLDGRGKTYVIERAGKAAKDMGESWNMTRDLAELSEDVTPHVLRHSRATHLMRQAVDPWQASKSLGMSLEMLQSTYGHHHPNWQKDAAEAK